MPVGFRTHGYSDEEKQKIQAKRLRADIKSFGKDLTPKERNAAFKAAVFFVEIKNIPADQRLKLAEVNVKRVRDARGADPVTKVSAKIGSVPAKPSSEGRPTGGGDDQPRDELGRWT